jgi:flagellar biosynthesis/type III secretory pathway protein FliH
MPFVTVAERFGREEGRKEGLDEGRKEGLDEGHKKGLDEGLLKGIEVGLKLKFGADGLQLLPDIKKQTDPAVLQAILDGLEAAKTLDDLRPLLP